MEKAAENVDAGAAAQLQLKLFGSWASSYTHRVQLAMRLKGLAFEYAEEDLGNKSDALLRLNPVYKKVPVLVHDGRSLAESVIILQYLDDAFPASRQLLPADAFDRAVARFWCHFGDDKLGPAVGAVFASTGEEQEAAVRHVHENLVLIEAELREGAFKGRRFFGGDEVGFLDVVLGCGSYWLAVFEEVTGVQLVDAEAFPLFHAWLRDFEAQDEVRETIPSIDRLLEYARGLRQMLVAMAAGAGAGAASADAPTAAPPAAAPPAATTADIAVDI
ncbi:glutathione transferase GST 23-like [Triticum urartu]|uniref:glutathione transferase n=1 Tax=Triticum urartu TaxID=4572 RepID=A0A8R7NZM2_TRIUA|nr:glutathione transferase GST 23-like [Triticum urartu]XP_048552980.1 glutathione transferase GST 23-like [Triticum urartu]XP_048554435.1 glutathione transferase GST 23-like [Triticum urartu]